MRYPNTPEWWESLDAELSVEPPPRVDARPTRELHPMLIVQSRNDAGITMSFDGDGEGWLSLRPGRYRLVRVS